MSGLLKADEKTLQIIGAVSQMLLDDMARNADFRVELSEKIGYSKGYNAGMKAGYAKAQRDLRSLIFGFQTMAGLAPQETEDCS